MTEEIGLHSARVARKPGDALSAVTASNGVGHVQVGGLGLSVHDPWIISAFVGIEVIPLDPSKAMASRAQVDNAGGHARLAGRFCE